jgi:hypothetical protein
MPGIYPTDRAHSPKTPCFQPCGVFTILVLGGAPIGTYPGGNQAVCCRVTALHPLLSNPLTISFVYVLPIILLQYSFGSES